MLQSELLHPKLISLLCSLGHTQTICICDAGLPVPGQMPCIDLALARNIPDFKTVLRLVNSNLVIEAGIAAEECREKNPLFYAAMGKLAYPLVYLPHEEFKIQALSCSAFIRTGECSPFANLILRAGVSF